ncbi:MAG: GNAT family N-acetyltransferase [Gammaproteobacteria bacterium]|nr:GNAT family N-acetyltransferase [Gammaproteobacteria bacterium]MDH3768155.1 GNAT family N-acetyltransferase [Gammaproteobacteria bacterium]
MTISPFEVRAATDADAEAVRGLVFPVMEEFGLGVVPDGADSDLYEIEASYTDRGGWLELLTRDGSLVGTVGMYPVGDDSIELRKMYLRADMRGAGLGKALLARSIERAQQAGFREIVLETATVLKTAIALYERFGFSRDVDDYPGCGKTACDQVWRLQLAGYELPNTNMPELQDEEGEP